MRRLRTLTMALSVVVLTGVFSMPVCGQQMSVPPLISGPDPDAGLPSQVSPASVLAAAAGDTCEQIGGADSGFLRANRYRANIFRVEDPSDLREIKFQLEFTGLNQLSFSVHRKIAGTTEFEPVFVGPLQTFNGQGCPGGVCPFYSTGMLTTPVHLDAGFDYAIGVSWNANARFFRDSLQYPLSFSEGLVLGSVGLGTSSNPINPPLDGVASIFLFAPFTGGAYSMRLCIDPKPGACCERNNPSADASGCALVLATECTGPGSFFHGPKTICEPGLCSFGACCFHCEAGSTGDGLCSDDYTRQACVAESGVWQGAGVTCQAGLCPVVTGACCQGDGTCTEKCLDDCDAANGTYRGDDTTCEKNPCVGACCVGGGCTNITSASCTTFGGDYKGDATDCAALPPGMECGGACCFGFDAATGDLTGCQVVASRADCVDQFPVTAYRGDATSCPANLDCGTKADFGPCCLPDGGCINTTAAFCAAGWVNGVFGTLGETCGDINVAMACSVESCCLPDGTCEDLLPTACQGRMGTSQGPGSLCMAGAMSCATQRGGCCKTDGTCEVLPSAACTAADGRYGGNGTDCTTASCTSLGACCRPSGACSELLNAAECTIAGGSFSQGQSCANAGCVQLGACCSELGTCIEVTETECQVVAGQFAGGGSACDGTVTCVTGACCVPEATPGAGPTCEAISMSGCEAAGGLYQGDLVDCEMGLCDLGACCDAAGGCTAATTAKLCSDVSSLFLGVASDCANNPCVLGSCCLGDGTCSDLRRTDCAAAGGRFQAGSTCGTVNLCPQPGACCLSAGGGCVVATKPDCLDQGGSFQGEASFCFLGLCTQGSCCVGDQSCNETNAFDCGRVFGDFAVGSDCAATNCSGACCLPDGRCAQMSPLICEARGGAFSVDQDCSAVACTSIGACCGSGQCSVTTMTACEQSGGIFQGGDTACDALRCLPGSCCRLDGTCDDGAVRSDCAGPGEVFNFGALCANVSCVPRGACCKAGGCVQQTSIACQAQGGIYSGDNTVCDDSLCGVGGCCLSRIASETNCMDTTAQACGTAGGVFQGDGVLCGSMCSGSGAACTSNQDCMTCNISGTSCTSVADCPAGEICQSVELCTADRCRLGACCAADGHCTDGALPSECAGNLDVFTIFDNCATLGCQPTGACCLPGGVCEVRTQSDCVAFGGQFDGGGTDCSRAGLCKVGACCLSGGACDDTTLTRQTCEVVGGTYEGPATSCSTSCSFGACCLDDGTCQSLFEVDCAAAGGVFTAGSTCLATACPVGGACCVGGACQILTQSACASAGGLHQGDGSVCDGPFCQAGACCESDGATCTENVIASQCEASNGRFRPRLDCSSAECAAVGALGACCFDDQACGLLTRAECEGHGGFYNGDQTACDASLCRLGACCMGDGTCQPMIEPKCTALGGIHNLGENCSSVSCPASGTCCRLDGVCEDDVFSMACAGVDDQFRQDQNCVDVTCDPRGACCTGDVCSIGTAADCMTAGGVYQGDGIACDVMLCTVAPIQMVSSTPPTGAIDARQPHDINDNTVLKGWTSVDVTFDGDATGVTTADFALTEVISMSGGGDGLPVSIVNIVTNVGGNPNVVTLQFDSPLEAQTWTKIEYTPSATAICLGFEPADVNGNGTGNTSDIIALVDALNGVQTRPGYSTDLDRGGVTNASDLTRLIDLLNGAGSFRTWQSVALPPSPCN